jgi:protein-tyrosine-phosphatase
MINSVPMKATLLLLMLSWSTKGFSQNENTIVFVCEHGGARSTIASLYFNKMAKESHLRYQSVFRALTPDSVLTKETRKGLIEDGFDTSLLTPVALTRKDIDSNTMLISLDCVVPEPYHPYRKWVGIPAISEDYRAARNKIVEQLSELISELKNKKWKNK